MRAFTAAAVQIAPVAGPLSPDVVKANVEKCVDWLTRCVEATGAEGVVADPDRLGTVMGALPGVSVVCWLMGSADDAPAVNGDRLATLMERLVDTPVRGLVYEGAGTVDAALLADGASIVLRAGDTWRIPVEVVEVDPASRSAWGEAMTAAVVRVLAA